MNPLYNASKEEFDKEISKRITEERDEVEPYVNKILKYVADKNKIFIVVDNVDQLEDSEYQNNVFIEGQAVARKVNSSIIMSLRDSTYLKHRNSPLFDAFQVDTIYIDPPSVLPVLSRRFAYAQKQVAGESASILSERGFTINVDNLGVFFKIVSSSLLEEDNGYMIEVMSGGNIRRALSLIREFLASGHISADKALRTYLSQGDYHFPTHEVFKGMIFGQKKFYREDESIIRNIFDSKLGRKNLQLLRLQILGYLVRNAADVSFDGMSFKLIKNDLYRLGIQNADCAKVVEDLLSNSALRTADGRPLHDGSKLIPTRFGGYWIKEMATRFDYLEPCLIDASIYDDEVWNKLSTITVEVESNSDVLPRLEKRLERVRVFLDYLLQIEQHWIVDCKRLNLELEWDHEFISSSKDAIEQELNSVFNSAKRHYS